MKKLNKFILVALCAIIGTSANAQIKISSNGYVGVGTHYSDPTANLDVVGSLSIRGNGGDITFTSTNHVTGYTLPIILPQHNSNACLGKWERRFYQINGTIINYQTLTQMSDKRMKTNIKTLDNNVLKIKKLNPVSYKFITPKNTEEQILPYQDGNDIGLLAQELKEVFPELVRYDSVVDLYSVNYIGLIPVLIGGMQEQQKTIEQLVKTTETLKTELAYYQTNCCTAIKDIKKSTDGNDGTTGKAQLSDAVANARLDQNAPNPFSKETRIGYFVPTEAKAAYLFIYDLQGKQLKQIALNTQGEGSATIQGREFTAGMYLYSLVIDNELVDTKRMILTE